MGRESYTNQSLGYELYDKMKKSRVLMVGAGGIGCELLKNLVLMGFGEIHVVDLDTIDLSNLNRQFLFRHEHIKKPKAFIAKESAGKFNPNVNIEAYHANIKDSQFDTNWFGKFDLVFNALDNMEARRHVNEMCIAGDIPLIESGTTGFKGQASVIKRGVTECYDCYPKEVQKSFPVCTIRSTPSQPIHCIVWAKSYLFNEVFGVGEEVAPDLDMTVSDENAQDIERLRTEALALQKIRSSMGTPDFPQLVFDKVFKNDVETLLSMPDMWKSRKAPQALDFASFKDQPLPSEGVRHVWNLEQAFAIFTDSLKRLESRMLQLKAKAKPEDPAPQLTFDKDDDDTLDFVAAAANLRSYVFGISTKSRFDIKQMAGNIIPAIATTNAIIAGACILQAIKVFRGAFEKAPMFMTTQSTDRLMISDRGAKPNPNCLVCGVAHTNLLIKDPKRAQLGSLVKTLKQDFDYGTDLTIWSDEGMIYEDDEDFEDMLSKSLSDLSIAAPSKLRVKDDSRVDLVLSLVDAVELNDQAAFEIRDKIFVPAKPVQETNGVSNGHTNGHTGSNGIAPAEPTVLSAGVKRKADDDVTEIDDRPATKAKMSSSNEPIVILDDDGYQVLD
jgi:ubiquitin-like 1-activating enzyme E1 B